MVHINLNMIFYTHIEDGPTETVYLRHYMEMRTHTHAHAHTHTHMHTQ